MWYSGGVKRATLRARGTEGVGARSLLWPAKHSGRFRVCRTVRAASWRSPALLASQLGRSPVSRCAAYVSPTSGVDGLAARVPTARRACSEGF